MHVCNETHASRQILPERRHVAQPADGLWLLASGNRGLNENAGHRGLQQLETSRIPPSNVLKRNIYELCDKYCHTGCEMLQSSKVSPFKLQYNART